MHKHFISLLFISATSIVSAQGSIDEVLNSIEQNNKSIAAAEQYVEAKNLEYRTGNTPDNPSVSADYMIGKPASGGNQFDFLAIQSFDFPTAYIHKGNLADERETLLQIELEEMKQNVLFEAKVLCLELVYLNQYKQILNKRIVTSQGIVDNYQIKYDAEQISGLELNKAKIQLLGHKSQLRSIESLIVVANEKLTELNGGNPLSISDTLYPDLMVVPEFEALNDSIESNDPRLKWYNQQSEVFQTQVKVNRSLALPQIETGYHYQTVLGQTFNGVHLGLTIPLWQNKNTVKSSQAYVEMNNFQTEEHKTEHYYYIRQLYEEHLNLQATIIEYKSVLGELNSEEILLQSLELGEIDFITYAMELEYYYKAKDDLLALEKEYQMIVAELFKYQL